MRMHNPPHPGEFIQETFLPATELSRNEIAKQLGVSPSTFSRLLNGYISVSPDMAIRLSKVLGCSPEAWLNMQAMYNLALAMEHEADFKCLHKIKFNKKVAQHV